MKNNKTATATPKELLKDLKTLVADAEAMIAESATEISAEALDSLRARYEDAQERFAEALAAARKKVVAGAKYTDEAIRANPYQSLAVAAGVALLVGLLLGRRCSK